MQTVPVEHKRIPGSYTADSRVHEDHGKTTMIDRGKRDQTWP